MIRVVLIGTEDEFVDELVVEAEDGYPPMTLRVAAMKPMTAGIVDEDGPTANHWFYTIEYALFDRDWTGTYIYKRTTPLWEGSDGS